MKLRFCAFNFRIYLPNGNGSTNDYVREPAYQIDQEGSVVLVRSRAAKNSQVIKVPFANVSCFEDMAEEIAPGKAEVKPPLKA